MVDRLLHKSEVAVIEGESYRHREAMEWASLKEQQRKVRRKKKTEEPAKKQPDVVKRVGQAKKVP
jgi:hypothetical protein